MEQNEKDSYSSNIRDGDEDKEFSVSNADEGLLKNEEFKCEESGVTYKQEASLYTHIQTQDSTSHQCFKCGKAFKLKKYLTKHMKSHNKESDFLCQICGKSYRSGHALKVHKDTKHEPYSKYQCPKCEKSLSCARRLKEHIQSHDAKSHRCDICNKFFTTATGLEQHQKRHSCKTTPRKFACTLCQKAFLSKGYLKQHEVIHKPPKFACPACGKCFKWKLSLNAHAKSCSS